jgi:molecular chaperone DnaK
VKSEIESALGEAKSAVESGDADRMTSTTQALAQAAMKLGQAIYEKEQAAAASPGAEAPEGAPADDDVVDAEFSEVDENKG